MAEERLQKILARGGLASRRHSETMITEGRVRVNGRIITELGSKADPRRDKIEVDGKTVVAEAPVYYALHKPRGYVTTLYDPEGRPTIKNLLRPHRIAARVFPVGRLDFNTSGILLLTNDGEFADGLLHPKKAVPKTYVVKVQGVMEAKDLDRWRKGVDLDDGRTQPAEAALIRYEGDKTWFEITIKEGRNQQIRRMGDATAFRVMRLARVSFAGITSEGLRPGDLRMLGFEELVELKKQYGVPRRPNVAKAPEPAPAMRGRAPADRESPQARPPRHAPRGPSKAALEATQSAPLPKTQQRPSAVAERRREKHEGQKRPDRERPKREPYTGGRDQGRRRP